MKLRLPRPLCCAAILLCLPAIAFAQRELHWERVDVDAHLDAAGTMTVTETQTMVFTGGWNGGERRFNLRPRQRLSFIGLARADGAGWRALSEDRQIDDIDEYAWSGANILRWRSRGRSDPPFAQTSIRYQLRYQLSGILAEEGGRYLLSHDFVFPERDGVIDHFGLRLTLDPVWQPDVALRELYTSERLPPGRGFVVTLALGYTGTGTPAVLDTSRPPAIVAAVLTLFGGLGLALLWFFRREQSSGRFAPLAAPVDEAWLRAHLFDYPAEVVGAAWDERVGAAEVVALIARMVADGKLDSKLDSEVGTGPTMELWLKVERNTLSGYEKSLIEKLFFDGRVKTSTDLVKDHYRAHGFDPAAVIRSELQQQVDRLLPGGRTSRRFGFAAVALFLAGCGLLLVDGNAGDLPPAVPWLLAAVALVLMIVAAVIGAQFRANIQWGRTAALACLTPALAAVGGAAVFLWFVAGVGYVNLTPLVVVATVSLALAISLASLDAMRSRRRPAAIRLRKTLAAARAFFLSELRKPQPALRDEWFPWIAAFGLGPQVDRWSAERADSGGVTAGGAPFTSSSTDASDSDSSGPAWTGFAGGRSGGAGGGATWSAAAGTMAAGVAPPGSSGSGGGGSSGGGGGGVTSGGGGGGGW